MMHVESDITIIAPAIAGFVLAVSGLIYFCFVKESSGSKETASKIDEFASILAGTKNDSKDAKNKKKSKKNMNRQQSQQVQQQQTSNAEKKQKREQQTKPTNVKLATSAEVTGESDLQPSATGVNLTVQRAKEEILAKAHIASDVVSQLTQNVREASTVASSKVVTAAQHAKEDIMAKANEVTEKATNLAHKTVEAAGDVLPANVVTAKLSTSLGKVQQQSQKLVQRADELKVSAVAAVLGTETGDRSKNVNSGAGADLTSNAVKVNKKQQQQQGQQKLERQKSSQSGKQENQQQSSKIASSSTNAKPAALHDIPVSSDGSFTVTNTSLLASGMLPAAPGQLHQVGKGPNANKPLHPGMYIADVVSRRSSTSSTDEQGLEQKRRVNALFQKKPNPGELSEVSATSASTANTTSNNKTVHAVGAVGDNNTFRSQSRQSNLSSSFADNNSSNPAGAAAAGGGIADNKPTKRPRSKPHDDRSKTVEQSKPVNSNAAGIGNGAILEQRSEDTTVTTTTTTTPTLIPVVRSTNVNAAAALATTGRKKANFKNMNGVSSSSVNEDVQQLGELILATNLTTEDYARLSRIVTEKGASVYGDEWFESNKKGTVRQTPNQQPALIPGFAAQLLHQKEQDLENEHKMASRQTQQFEQLQKQNQQLQRQLNDVRTKSQTETQHVRQQYEQTMHARTAEVQRLKEQLQSLAPQLSETQRLRAELGEKTSQFEQIRQAQLTNAQQYEREKQQLLRELHGAKQEANEQRSRDIEQTQQQLHEQHQQELQALQQQTHAREHHLQQQVTELERAIREREADIKRVEERVQHKTSDAVEKLNVQVLEHVQTNKSLERQLAELHGELDASATRHQTTISTTEEKVRQLEQQIEQREREWQKTSSDDKLEAERLRKQVAEAAAVPVDDLRRSLDEKQKEVDRLTAQCAELEQERKKRADKAADKSNAELESLRKRAEQAEAQLVTVEQKTAETSRQERERVVELETANQQLGSELQKLREKDERHSTQVKELKENSRRIRQEMEQHQAAAAALALSQKESVTSTESSEYEIVNHNNNNNVAAADSALLHEQIRAVDVLRNEVSTAEKLVNKLESGYRELVEAHNRGNTTGSGNESAANGDVTVVTKRVVTVTTEHHDIPLSSTDSTTASSNHQNDGENLVEEIRKVDVGEPSHS